jgi:hypothetical protein
VVAMTEPARGSTEIAYADASAATVNATTFGDEPSRPAEIGFAPGLVSVMAHS